MHARLRHYVKRLGQEVYSLEGGYDASLSETII